MLRPREIPVSVGNIDAFASLLDSRAMALLRERIGVIRERLAGRVFWHISSTEKGGGVAALLPSLLAYARGAGIDARWVVIEGTPEFFHLTKRLHHALHGSSGDGSPLGAVQHALYDGIIEDNAEELLPLVRPDDCVVLHDPQTAGLAVALTAVGARVVWRCHIGTDHPNFETELGWEFLQAYLPTAEVAVFSRARHVPDFLRSRALVIPPSIDVFAVKNQQMTPEEVNHILCFAGLIDGPRMGPPSILGHDGVMTRLTRRADLRRLGRPPLAEVPLIVQVSRWDPLKDPVGVMHGFAQLARHHPGLRAELVLAGPPVHAVADDPEAAAVYEQVEIAWHQLPYAERELVHLASLPMASIDENSAMVNALQRHAAVVVQKSLEEGFGLTVTEAMWKGRPVVASAVGGIQDQIVDGVNGLLVRDPRDLEEFAATLARPLLDRALAERIGLEAREQVLRRFLGSRSLVDWAEVVERVGQGSDRGLSAGPA